MEIIEKKEKDYINKHLLYNIEKWNQCKCYLGKLLVNSGCIYLMEYYIGIKNHSYKDHHITLEMLATK